MLEFFFVNWFMSGFCFINSKATSQINMDILYSVFQQHLTVAAGENRHSIHRAQRWFDATEKALGYTVGPEMQSDLETREKLTRPLVRVYQRHPGTNLPEAQDIIRVSMKGCVSFSLVSISLRFFCYLGGDLLIIRPNNKQTTEKSTPVVISKITTLFGF